MSEKTSLEDIISLCKRRGFIYQGSDIYGGLSGTWDYGPLGVMLRDQVKKIWWNRFVDTRTDMYGVDAAILMNSKVWKSSGHVDTFADPLVEDLKTKKRYRADHILESARLDVSGKSVDEMNKMIVDNKIKSPDGNDFGEVRQFNMMFKTNAGPIESDDNVVYLRPETAQGMFVNFKNIQDTFHPKLPFGMAQIGKAFRNEIAPRDFIFRNRELEQMEIEYFVDPKNWEETFSHFQKEIKDFTIDIGLDQSKVHELEVAEGDRAHYSKRTVDFEYDFPIGKKELFGLAYRTDFDLKAHMEGSKVDLSYFDEENKVRFVPHCIEPSFGVERTVLAILTTAYTVDNLGGEERVFLKLSPAVSPYRIAVFPLVKNKEEITGKAKEVWESLRKIAISKGISPAKIVYDETQSIGKRYRRQDEVGTPICITIDFDTLEKGTVTVRDRDTGEQRLIKVEDVGGLL
jgi:glycyl-tRNA synthetase